MAARFANKTKEHDNSTTQNTDKGPTQPHARSHWRFVGARALSCNTSPFLPDARAPRAEAATRGALRADGCVKHGAHEGGDERARNLVCTRQDLVLGLLMISNFATESKNLFGPAMASRCACTEHRIVLVVNLYFLRTFQLRRLAGRRASWHLLSDSTAFLPVALRC